MFDLPIQRNMSFTKISRKLDQELIPAELQRVRFEKKNVNGSIEKSYACSFATKIL